MAIRNADTIDTSIEGAERGDRSVIPQSLREARGAITSVALGVLALGNPLSPAKADELKSYEVAAATTETPESPIVGKKVGDTGLQVAAVTTLGTEKGKDRVAVNEDQIVEERVDFEAPMDIDTIFSSIEDEDTVSAIQAALDDEPRMNPLFVSLASVVIRENQDDSDRIIELMDDYVVPYIEYPGDSYELLVELREDEEIDVSGTMPIARVVSMQIGDENEDTLIGLKGDNERLSQALTQIRADISVIQTERGVLQAELAQLIAENDAARAENAKLAAENDAARAENAKLAAENDAAGAELAQLIAENDATRLRIAAIDKRIASLDEGLEMAYGLQAKLKEIGGGTILGMLK